MTGNRLVWVSVTPCTKRPRIQTLDDEGDEQAAGAASLDGEHGRERMEKEQRGDPPQGAVRIQRPGDGAIPGSEGQPRVEEHKADPRDGGETEATDGDSAPGD